MVTFFCLPLYYQTGHGSESDRKSRLRHVHRLSIPYKKCPAQLLTRARSPQLNEGSLSSSMLSHIVVGNWIGVNRSAYDSNPYLQFGGLTNARLSDVVSVIEAIE